jgi:hypothetical protein
MKTIKLIFCFFFLFKLSITQANVRDLLVSGITSPENANGTYIYQGLLHVANLVDTTDTHYWMNTDGNYIFWGDYGNRDYWFIDDNDYNYDDCIFYIENSDEYPPFTGYTAETGSGTPLIKYAPPEIETVSYNCNSNLLSIVGTNFVQYSGSANDVDVSKITITGEGGVSYSLQNSSDVEITSITQISLTLSGVDLINIEALLNNNGVLSADNSSYNLAVEDDWMPGYEESSDDIGNTTTAISVSGYTVPQITSALYHAGTGTLSVTGTNFVVNNNGVSDIDLTKFTITGGDNITFTLTESVDISLTSDTELSFTLEANDKLQINTLLNQNGLSSLESVVYNIAAQDDWLYGSPLSYDISDLTGNSIDVSNVYSISTSSVVQTDAVFFTATGSIDQIGSINPVAYGFCWNIAGSPTITDNSYDFGEASSTGSYTALITSFLSETRYAVRAYMISPWDTLYGTEVSITTLAKLAEPGNTLYFDGVDDYVTIDETVIPATGDFTAEVWYNADTDITGYCEMLSQGAGSDGEDFYIGITSGGNIRAGDDWLDTGIGFPADGHWHHIAVTKSDAATILYLDGSMRATNTTTIVNPAGTNFRIGRQYGLYSEYFKGKIDEIRVWNTERTADEIFENKNAILNGNEEGLVAYYNFNSGITAGTNTIDTLVDISQNGYHMSLTNFALTGSSSNWVESYALVVPTATDATSINAAGFTANWIAPTSGTVNNYLLEVATDADFTNLVTGYDPLSVASTSTSLVVTDLTLNTTYYYHISADKTSVTSEGSYSNSITTITQYPSVTTFNNDGNWATASNWSNGLPGSSSNAIIDGICNVDVDSEVTDLNINSGQILTIDSGNTLSVSGTLINNADTTGIVIASGGNLVTNSSVLGTVELAISEDVWHYIGIPVSETQNLLPTFKGFWIIQSDESSADNDTETGWSYLVDGSTLLAGSGYGFYHDLDTTLIVKGTLNASDKNVSINKTNIGWNLIANPYPCTIDWSLIDDGLTNKAIYVYNGSSYDTWNETSGGHSQYLAPMQGFFVEADGSETVPFTHASKTVEASTFKSALIDPIIRLALTPDGKSFDQTTIRINTNATKAFEGSMDAHKLIANSGFSQFYTLYNQEKYSINVIPEINEELIIPIEVSIQASGEHTLLLQELENYAGEYPINLFSENGKLLANLEIEDYVFEATKDEIVTLYIGFTSTFVGVDVLSKNNISLSTFNTNLTIHGMDNIPSDVLIYNLTGQQVYRKQVCVNELNVNISDKGIYIVKVKLENGSIFNGKAVINF